MSQHLGRQTFKATLLFLNRFQSSHGQSQTLAQKRSLLHCLKTLKLLTAFFLQMNSRNILGGAPPFCLYKSTLRSSEIPLHLCSKFTECRLRVRARPLNLFQKNRITASR